MGMFDNVKCEVPLPDGWEPQSLLQTKDFGCQMVTHVITAEGRLLLERIDETHVVPKEERPYPDEGGLLGMVGMLRTVKSQYDSGYHGVVNFYGSEFIGADGKPARPVGGVTHFNGECRDSKTGELLKHVWHEYNAKFTDGQLVGIELVDPTTPWFD